MTAKSKFAAISQRLLKRYPNPKIELNYSTPFQLLVSTILAAQCTDQRVNLVTQTLYQNYPDAETISQLSLGDLTNAIKSISFCKAKAKSVLATAKRIQETFHGVVPQTLDDLVSLPGVGRKTANVILSNIYGQPALAVDTHVFRVTNRLGLTHAVNALETETQLLPLMPPEQVGTLQHCLTLFGRYVCKAKAPSCNECDLTHYCDYYQSLNRN